MNQSFWKKIAKTSMIYMVGTVIAKVISFCMLPLYTSYISTEAYGIYDAVIAYSAIIIPLVGANCWQGMLRFLAGKEGEKNEQEIISNGWLMLTLSVCLLCFGYGCFCIFIPFENKLLVFLYFLTLMIQYFYLYTARGFQENTLYAISGLLSAIVVAVSSLICIYWFRLQIETLYISQIVSFIIQIFFIEWKLHILSKFDIKLIQRTRLKELYQYCLPESVSTIFNWLLSGANRLIIVGVLGFAANGVYAISNKFLTILNVFMTAFVLSFQEAIFSTEKDEMEHNANDVILRFTKIAGALVAFILLGTSIIFPWFVSGEYTDGYNLIPLFYLYFLFTSLNWILSSVVAATKKMKILLWEKMIVGIINFALMALLVHHIGLSSSPLSLIAAELIGIFVFKLLLKKQASFQVDIPLFSLILDIFLVGCAALVFYFNNVWLTLGCLLAMTAYFFVKYWTIIKAIIKKITQNR